MLIQWQDNLPRTVYPEDIAGSPVLDPGTGEPYENQFDKFK